MEMKSLRLLMHFLIECIEIGRLLLKQESQIVIIGKHLHHQNQMYVYTIFQPPQRSLIGPHLLMSGGI